MLGTDILGFGAKEVRAFRENGYYFPVQVLAEEEVSAFNEKFLNHLAETREQRQKLSARDQYVVFSECHTYLNWVYRIVSHPKVLDAVEAILGPKSYGLGLALVRQDARGKDLCVLASGRHLLGLAPSQRRHGLDRAVLQHP